MLLSFFKISRLQLFPLPKTASGSQSNTTRSRRRGRRTVGSPCRRSAPMPRGLCPPARRRVSATRRKRSGAVRRCRPREFGVSWRICSGSVIRGYRARRWRAYCRASFGTVTTWRRWPVGSRPARHGCSCRAGTYGSANRQG